MLMSREQRSVNTGESYAASFSTPQGHVALATKGKTMMDIACHTMRESSPVDGLKGSRG